MIRVQLSKELDSFEQEVSVTIFFYFNFYKQCWSYIVSIQKYFFGKNSIRKNFLFYKKCVTEKKTYLNKGCNLLKTFFSNGFVVHTL